MQDGHDDFQRGPSGLRLDIYGDTIAVVADRHARIRMDGDYDRVAPASQGLVDRVVDHFIHEVVEAALIRTADIHAGAPTYGLEALEDLNVRRGIRCRLGTGNHL